MAEPKLTVGILTEKRIKFALFGDFTTQSLPGIFNGPYTAEISNGKIKIANKSNSQLFESGIIFTPSLPADESFLINDVIIGVKFHWERKEKQSFRGSIQFIIEDDKITVINVVHIEEYLKSVISSEMSSKSSLNLLKAHAVISRSWLLAQIETAKIKKDLSLEQKGMVISDTEIIRWYDREDHQNFDVCADDHCQRYQGITKFFTDSAFAAVEETRGLVMKYGDEICDARFSKSCGGISEPFENVWENTHHPYLVDIIDYKFEPDGYNLDFSVEKNAIKWIDGDPHAYCNTNDSAILSQVLLQYDRETSDFFRWKVVYSQEKVKELLKKRLDFDGGDIIDMIPVQRGKSSRLIKLKIKGTGKEIVIGKELEIRRALSDSHLYSSAFYVEKKNIIDGVPQVFVLHGAGWGHGAGLCQIGAAVMAERGFQFDEILTHYYKSVDLVKLY